MVVGVGAAAEGFVGWGYPFGGAVAAFSGGPAAAFDQAVVGSAGQVEVVDVGGSALGPVGGGVVDLAAVAGHGAAREGTTRRRLRWYAVCPYSPRLIPIVTITFASLAWS